MTLKTWTFSTLCLALLGAFPAVQAQKPPTPTTMEQADISEAELEAMARNVARMQQAVMVGDVNTVEKLLSQGMNPNLRLPNKDTLLTFAYRSDAWAVVKLLLANSLTDINLTNDFGESPLMLAVIKGREADVDELLNRGAAVNMPKGWTPLHYAATEGNVKLIDKLLKLGANVNAQTSAGVTPLIMAARKPSRAAVTALLKAGAYRDYCTDSKASPADFARRAGDEELAEYLKVEKCSQIGPKNPEVYGIQQSFADFLKQNATK